MPGKAHNFSQYAKKNSYAIERCTNETSSLYRVLDKQLSKLEYVAGDYSIADMAIYPWIVPQEKPGQNLANFPHLK